MVKFDEVDKCFKIAFRVEACYNKKADNNGYYVINYLYQVSYLIPPSSFYCGWQTHFYFRRRRILFLLIAKAFWNYQHSW